jgi:hypothetical protein
VASPRIAVRRAETFWTRFRGLLGSAPPAPGHALWLRPCNQVHTLFMRYPIDVVFLDAEERVVEAQTLQPWRLGARCWRAHSVLELAAGEAARLGLGPGTKPTLITR